jgi:hypothetical protein
LSLWRAHIPQHIDEKLSRPTRPLLVSHRDPQSLARAQAHVQRTIRDERDQTREHYRDQYFQQRITCWPQT